MTMILVNCPKCGNVSKALNAHEGRKGRCPHCTRTIEIRQTEKVPSNPPDADESDAPQHATDGRRKHRASIGGAGYGAVIFAAAVAVGLTWLFYTQLLPIMPDRVVTLAARRGYIPYVEMYVAFWLLSMLGIKAIQACRQRRWMRRWENCLFTDEDKASGDLAETISHLENQRPGSRSLFLGRVLMAMRHFRVVRQVQEVRDALVARSAIDANRLDASYVTPRVLVWAIPILGFLGTVYGISDAISQFSGLLPSIGESAKEASAMRDALGKVTEGLAIAFDTTLLALCLVLPLMLFTSWAQKAEQAFLHGLDTFCNEELTKWFYSYSIPSLVPETERAPNEDTQNDPTPHTG